MITVNNRFQDNYLKIDFSGDSINDKTIDILVTDDVNFKSVVDFLVEIIPLRVKLASSFMEFDAEENPEKLQLIKETLEEIFLEFNTSIESTVNHPTDEVVDTTSEVNDTERDDLPF